MMACTDWSIPTMLDADSRSTGSIGGSAWPVTSSGMRSDCRTRPDATQAMDICDTDGLMWTGSYAWPDTYLRPDELGALSVLPYFVR